MHAFQILCRVSAACALTLLTSRQTNGISFIFACTSNKGRLAIVYIPLLVLGNLGFIFLFFFPDFNIRSVL